MKWLEGAPRVNEKVNEWSASTKVKKELLWEALDTFGHDAMGQSSVIYFGREAAGKQRFSTNTHACGASASGKSEWQVLLKELGVSYKDYNKSYSALFHADHSLEQCYPIFENCTTMGEFAVQVRERRGMGIAIFPEQGMCLFYCFVIVFFFDRSSHLLYRHPCTKTLFFFVFFLFFWITHTRTF